MGRTDPAQNKLLPCNNCHQLTSGNPENEIWTCSQCDSEFGDGCIICYGGSEEGQLYPLDCGDSLLIHKHCLKKCNGAVMCLKCTTNTGVASIVQLEASPVVQEEFTANLSSDELLLLAQTLVQELQCQEHIIVTLSEVRCYLRNTRGVTRQNSHARLAVEFAHRRLPEGWNMQNCVLQ